MARFILPGDLLADGSRAYHAGVHRDLENENSILRIMNPHRKIYTPLVGDIVLGIVSNRTSQFYRVDINSFSTAILPILNFNGATNKHKPNLQIGMIVLCSILEIPPDTEVVLTCKDNYTAHDWTYPDVYLGTVHTTTVKENHIDITAKNKGCLGNDSTEQSNKPLKIFYSLVSMGVSNSAILQLVDTSACLSKLRSVSKHGQQLDTRDAMKSIPICFRRESSPIGTIGKYFSFEASVGANGRVLLISRSQRELSAIRSMIMACENLTDIQIEALAMCMRIEIDEDYEAGM